jgi:predicted PurR-regulated permease PerM
MEGDSRSSMDLTRTTLAVLWVCALILLTVWIMSPFLSALLWAAMIVISTWPILTKIQSKLGGRRGFATAIMTIALLLVLLIPLGFAISALMGSTDSVRAKADALQTFVLPPPPEWVARIPIQGPKLAAEWQQLSGAGHDALAERLAPYAGRVLRWFAARIGGVGGMILQFLLTVIISAILYVNGETAASGVRKFAARLAGENGDRAAVLAASTIRAVAMGVIVTAVVQTVIAGTGLVITSVPGAAIFIAAVFVFCLAQLGPILVMIPALIWKFHSGDSLGGFILLAFTLVAGTIDNFLRPILIKKGADLPLVMIFAGVIGGMITFGIMGIFIGPVILAVTYVLVREWVNMHQVEEPEAPSQPNARVKILGATSGDSV